MNIYVRNIVAIVLLLPFGLISQTHNNKDIELGNFFISHYKRDFLRSSFSNLVVLQDKEGVIYVGNWINGLIEFDGQRVRRVLQSGKPMIALIRGAEIDSKNTIYLGLGGTNFGYLEKNKFGQNEYVSLSDQLPKKADVFWGLEVYQDTVFFQTENAVYLYKDKKYLRTYKFKDNLHIISSSPDGVYLRIWGKGLFKYAAKDGFSVIKGSEKLFAQNPIDANYQLDNGDHLLVSRNIGLIRMTKKGEFFPVNNPYANKHVMEGKSNRNDKVMRNGKIALITNDKGILFLNQDLSTNAEVGMSSGLLESGLNFIMQDRVGDIWGANSGVTKISFDPSLTNFSSLNGIEGGVGVIIRHKGKLIIRTRNDLFQFVPKKSMTETSLFKSLDVKELGFSLSLFDDQFVCTNNNSINAVLNGKKLKISDTGRNRHSIQSKLNPSLLFSSNLTYGLLLHQFNGKVWKQIKIIGGEKYSGNNLGNNLTETKPGKIILSTLKGIVLFKYDLSGQGTFTFLPQDKSFAKTKETKIVYLNDTLLVSVDSTNKFFIIDDKAQKLRYTGFSLDEMVSGELWNYTYNKEAGYGWLVCKKGLFKTYFDIKKGFTFKKYPFYKVDLDELSYNVLPEGSGDNEVIWFGSQENKLYRYVPALALKEPAQQFKALIRSISSNGEPVPIEPETLPFSQNNLVFEVAYPLFGTENKTTFSYWLENQDDRWSEYIKDFKKEYNNLREGTYTFHVRAMDASGHVSDEARVKFKIAPPWYRTILAYLVYMGLLGYLFILFGKYQVKKSRGKAEDERKNKELKAAKDLQNSMLPKVLPQNADLDIAVFIRSSTEVGGDYYDFFEHKGKALYSICGDATGHGVASGMMVSVTKAGLNGIDALPVNTILHKLNNIVKNIDLGTLRMSLNVVQIKSNEFELSSAGMPPVYHYVAGTNKVEEILTVGLPLGGLREEHFDIIKRSFNKGDIIVQLSDGLPEAPNLVGEMYDYERLHQLIGNNGTKSAQGMIDSLIASVDSWLQGQHNPDDITLVIIKKIND